MRRLETAILKLAKIAECAMSVFFVGGIILFMAFALIRALMWVWPF